MILTAYLRRRRGFTMLEMSIVLVILGVIVSGIMTVFTASLAKRQYQETVTKMELIQKTLYSYRVAFNRLPCPADATLANTNANFGVEANNPGSCTGGAIAANFSQSPVVGAQDAREGMVPVRTLRLPDDYAYDGWGRRFMYSVSRDATQSGAFTIISGFDTSARMTIRDRQGGTKSTLAIQVLSSAGPNGHGAFPRSGGATRISVGSVNTDEQNNCDCDNTATATAMNATFVQKDITQDPANKLNVFDDLILFTTRMDYILPASLVSQPFDTSSGGNTGVGGGGSVTGGSCFPAGTPILTPSGEVDIETLKVGDEVIAVDSGKRSHTVRITGTSSRQSRILVLETDAGPLRTTAGHHMWIGGQEFRPAGDLKTGDTVMAMKDGKVYPTTVRGLHFEEGEATVYNMEVDDLHTFVAKGFVVHNASVVADCGTCTTTLGITTCNCAF